MASSVVYLEADLVISPRPIMDTVTITPRAHLHIREAHRQRVTKPQGQTTRPTIPPIQIHQAAINSTTQAAAAVILTTINRLKVPAILMANQPLGKAITDHLRTIHTTTHHPINISTRALINNRIPHTAHLHNRVTVGKQDTEVRTLLKGSLTSMASMDNRASMGNKATDNNRTTNTVNKASTVSTVDLRPTKDTAKAKATETTRSLLKVDSTVRVDLPSQDGSSAAHVSMIEAFPAALLQ